MRSLLLLVTRLLESMASPTNTLAEDYPYLKRTNRAVGPDKEGDIYMQLAGSIIQHEVVLLVSSKIAVPSIMLRIGYR